MKLLLSLAAAGGALALASGAHAETSCTDLAHARLAHAEVTQAMEVDAGGKPACKVSVTSRPTADSEIRIEVWIPRGEAWNGKYVQVGNGGLAGQIPVASIKAQAEKGYASAGTDDGHASNGRTAEWAQGHPEKIKDFAWRSLKETTDAAKALITAQKGSPLARSYFLGCSAGGREALMEAQRFPNDFDGIISGAAANYNTQGTAGRAYMMQALNKPGGYLDRPALERGQRVRARIDHRHQAAGRGQRHGPHAGTAAHVQHAGRLGVAAAHRGQLGVERQTDGIGSHGPESMGVPVS